MKLAWEFVDGNCTKCGEYHSACKCDREANPPPQTAGERYIFNDTLDNPEAKAYTKEVAARIEPSKWDKPEYCTKYVPQSSLSALQEQVKQLENLAKSAVLRLGTTSHKDAWNDAREVAQWFSEALKGAP